MADTPIYALNSALRMRWANPENYHADVGAGGQANYGRKGSPCRGALHAGETWELLHAEGMGTVRRIWITLSDRSPAALCGVVVRMYWDGVETPAVVAPLGDFFASPLGRCPTFSNEWFNNPEGRNFNCHLPMPFRTTARITVTNESPNDIGMFWYHIDYTLGDVHNADSGYFHAHYRRENPTVMRRDFEILPRIEGRGRFLGCSIGVICDTRRYGNSWWGEGEVKLYLDGDTDFPTLCGTGTEDYICTSWGLGRYALPWYGCPLADFDTMQFGFYRLHGPDPVYFQRELRVAIQQIGCDSRANMLQHMRQHGIPELILCGDGSGRITLADMESATPDDYFLFEREDDWSATAYFYLDRPTNNLPPIAPYAARIANLTGDADPNKRMDA